MREDRNVLDLLTADYTFVNERLARHYGIPNVYGSQLPPREASRMRIAAACSARGAVLAVTSYPNRTSPVMRGKWILESDPRNAAAAAAAQRPALAGKREGGKVSRSARGWKSTARTRPAPAVTAVMDPLGFSLENFDATGEWRANEAVGIPVDSTGQLADGTKVNGPVALRQAILKHPEQFVRTMTEKMLTYGLGRGLEHYDMPIVRAIARRCRERELSGSRRSSSASSRAHRFR